MTTPADYRALCAAAGLTVHAAERVGAQIRVVVQRKRVPQSASGLAALGKRLGVKGMLVSWGNDEPVLWFMAHQG